MLLDQMPYEELLNWMLYFKSRPIDWRDDNRAYMLLAAQGVKEKPEKLFSSLASIKESNNNAYTEEEKLAQTLRSSGLLGRLKDAAKTNSIDWNIE